MMKYERFSGDMQSDMHLCICGRDENLRPGIRYGPVIRDSYIIECCTGGYGSVIINGVEFSVKSGDCVILLPGDVIIHVADEREPRRGVWCGVKGMRIGSYLSALGITSDSPYIPADAFDAVTEKIERMLDMAKDTDAGAELRREGLIHSLFGELMRYAKRETDTGVYTKKAMHIMEMRYSEELTVADIASELGLERCYFSTVFKNSTGKTPYAYLNELRIKIACTLLSDSDISISETAQAVGIEPINFARVFKKHTGVLPTEYRKKSDRQ